MPRPVPLRQAVRRTLSTQMSQQAICRRLSERALNILSNGVTSFDLIRGSIPVRTMPILRPTRPLGRRNTTIAPSVIPMIPWPRRVLTVIAVRVAAAREMVFLAECQELRLDVGCLRRLFYSALSMGRCLIRLHRSSIPRDWVYTISLEVQVVAVSLGMVVVLGGRGWHLGMP